MGFREQELNVLYMKGLPSLPFHYPPHLAVSLRLPRVYLVFASLACTFPWRTSYFSSLFLSRPWPYFPLIFHIHRFSPVDPSQLLLHPHASSLWGSQSHLGLSFPFPSLFLPKIEPHYARWFLTYLGTLASQWQECPCQARCDRAAGTEQAGVWVWPPCLHPCEWGGSRPSPGN